MMTQQEFSTNSVWRSDDLGGRGERPASSWWAARLGKMCVT